MPTEHTLRGRDGESTASCHCPIGKDHDVDALEARLGPATRVPQAGGKMLRRGEDKMLRGSGD